MIGRKQRNDMSATPRTDEYAFIWTTAVPPYEGREIVSADFARELETEITKLKQELADYSEDFACLGLPHGCQAEQLLVARDRIRKLTLALNKLRDTRPSQTWVNEIIDQALK
jgi:hypothetical protein